MRLYKVTGLSCLVACLSVIACSWDESDTKEQAQTPPVTVEPDQPTTVQNPPILNKNAQGQLELIVSYKKNRLYNPNTDQWDDVLLRGYLTQPTSHQNHVIDKHDPVTDVLVGPQIRAKQGEVLSVVLNNQLPIESQSTCPTTIDDVNQGHCFNTTNLHTHGLWVSPQHNSDNVFVKIPPLSHFNYEFKIEPNHPAGTFWYHSHVHGSTALQVSSGMAGPLIIEGSRAPTVENGKIKNTGDIDILWNAAKNTNEKVLVFQQIQYKCKDNNDDKITDKSCLGTIEDYSDIGVPSSWGEKNYHTSINGKIWGEIKVNQNEFSRWRMIHAGIRDTIGLIIKELPNSSHFTAEQTQKACESYQSVEQREAFMRLKTLPMHTIAQDGLTMSQIQSRSLSVFQPGYRHDAMLSFPTTNKYCLYDTKLNLDDQINSPIFLQLPSNSNLAAQFLAWVNVSPTDRPTQSPADFLQQQAKKIGLAADIIKQLSERNLSAFVSNASLINPATDRLITEDTKQFSAFGIQGTKFGLKHKEEGELLSFGDPYSGENAINGQYVRKLKLGQTDEWEITSTAGGHPFHIHVNPFQIVKILDRNNVDVSGLDSDHKDYNVDGSVDVQYYGLKGTWKDTLFVKNGYRVIVRTKYEKFEGDFVLHCHILDHEDRGMMEVVRICGDQYPCDADLPSHDHSHQH